MDSYELALAKYCRNEVGTVVNVFLALNKILGYYNKSRL